MARPGFGLVAGHGGGAVLHPFRPAEAASRVDKTLSLVTLTMHIGMNAGSCRQLR